MSEREGKERGKGRHAERAREREGRRAGARRRGGEGEGGERERDQGRRTTIRGECLFADVARASCATSSARGPAGPSRRGASAPLSAAASWRHSASWPPHGGPQPRRLWRPSFLTPPGRLLPPLSPARPRLPVGLASPLAPRVVVIGSLSIGILLPRGTGSPPRAPPRAPAASSATMPAASCILQHDRPCTVGHSGTNLPLRPLLRLIYGNPRPHPDTVFLRQYPFSGWPVLAFCIAVFIPLVMLGSSGGNSEKSDVDSSSLR